MSVGAIIILIIARSLFHKAIDKLPDDYGVGAARKAVTKLRRWPDKED